MTPDSTAAGNGLMNFSLHAFDTPAANIAEQLQIDGPRRGGMRSLQPTAEVDPETAARRLLDRALVSSATPSLAAPVANGTSSEFRLIGTETVPLTGTRTVKFRQTLHGIPVYGSLVTVELEEDNSMVGIDSALGEPADVDPVAAIAPAQALAAASSAAGYTANLDGIVPRLNYYFDRKTSSWRLVYILEHVPVSLDAAAEDKSARKSSLEPPHYMDYVIDAHTAKVVALLPRTPSLVATEQQSAVDAFGVVRTFTASRASGQLVLLDPVHNVQTFDFRFADPDVDADQLPGDPIVNPPGWEPGAVSAHANAVAVSEFLHTVLKRDNIDGRGGMLKSTINCVVVAASKHPKEWVNAFWNGEQMVYGQVLRPDGLRSLSANVDVVAHEMFHGVTEHTARLEYALQPGAMNESYSDIFGTIVANLGNDDPRTWDWQLGEKLMVGDQPFRDLQDPTKFGQPAHMDQFKVLPNTRPGDWGGVHTNSGIHNKVAYNLLTAELDNHALALTPAEVAAVFYLTLTQRLSRTSQFADSRRGAVASARSLFRLLPAEQRDAKVAAVDNAFAAVGIA
jgi:Zn-dependent metalloprotease